ncbi:MAG: hypothetical protein IPL32_17255 [Chloracidobacterium sp.]|nr:hypothetical protein [Chloracidobacterium sp.]
MKVHLTRTKGFSSGELLRVSELLIRNSGPIRFIPTNKYIAFAKDNFDWDDLFKEMAAFRDLNNIPPEDFLVCITELKDDWDEFSMCDPWGTNNIFVQGANWESYIYSETHYPIAFEVVINILRRKLLPGFEWVTGEAFLHGKPRGCINDSATDKAEVALKMRTGDICADCLQGLEATFADKRVLKQAVEIFDTLRRGMMWSRVYLTPLSFESHLPFSIAITKRKTGMTSESFRKFLMMIDHFDSIVRTAVIMLAHLYYSGSEDTKVFFSEHGLTGRPALGTWVSALSELARSDLSSQPVDLPPNFSSRVKKVIQFANEGNIVSIRNEMRGHGYIECGDGGYQQELKELSPIIEQIEQSLSPLFHRYRLHYVAKLHHQGKGLFAIDHVPLSGSNAAFVEDKLTVEFSGFDDLPEAGKCFLVNSDYKEWTCLDPYMKYVDCPECRHPRLLVYDGEVYLDPFVGHRVRLNV